jgi:hypothetical protein
MYQFNILLILGFFIPYIIGFILYYCATKDEDNEETILYKSELIQNNTENVLNYKDILLKFFRDKSVWIICLINVLSKIEKIQWKDNLITKYNKYMKYLIYIPNIIPIFYGLLYDCLKFDGFKLIINIGNFVNIVFSLLYLILDYFIYNNKKDNYFIISITFIILVLTGGYYAIFVPELIERFNEKYIMEYSGIISLGFIFSKSLELLLIKIKINKTIDIIIFFIQIAASLGIFFIFYFQILSKQSAISVVPQHQKFDDVYLKNILFKTLNEDFEENEKDEQEIVFSQ